MITDSNSAPVLVLRPLSKVSGYTKANCHLLGACDRCGDMGSQAVVRVKPSEFIRPKQTIIWSCEGRALHRNGMLVACVREKWTLPWSHTTHSFLDSAQTFSRAFQESAWRAQAGHSQLTPLQDVNKM